MLKTAYDKMIYFAGTRYAMAALAFFSFIESSIFPIPPDILLITIVLARRSAAWLASLLCTIFSVIGALVGYLIGFMLFDTVGLYILGVFGYDERFAVFTQWYHDWGSWIVLFAGLTPFPYKVITIASGALGLNLITFILASIVARGIRFFFVGWLIYRFGAQAREFIEKRLGLLFFALMAIIILMVILIRLR